MPSAYVGIVSAGSQGLPSDTLVRTDRNNFAPRLGVAYRPFNDSQTVIRAGYGLYYDLLPIELQAARAPFVFTETPFTNPAAPSLVLPAVFPAAGTAGPSAIALPLAVNPDVRMPYSHQWSVTVEHERWHTGFRVSYVGTLGRDMWYTRDANAPEADGRLYTEKPRPFPQYSEHHVRGQRREPRLPRRHVRRGTTVLGRACSSRRPTRPRRTRPRRWNGRTPSRTRSTWRANAAVIRPRRCTALTTARDVRAAVRAREARG